jgi:hypothetical protein
MHIANERASGCAFAQYTRMRRYPLLSQSGKVPVADSARAPPGLLHFPTWRKSRLPKLPSVKESLTELVAYFCSKFAGLGQVLIRLAAAARAGGYRAAGGSP